MAPITRRILIAAIAAALAAFLVSASVAAPPTLKIGSKAPPLVIAKWVKGGPITGFENNKVYVVEFWATWCGPCRQTIPHLTELAKKYGNKVTFIGVDIWEYDKDPKSTAYFAKVEKFVKDMGDKMAYNVGIDGPDKTMATTWMDAAGRNGIPSAFIVGRTGCIVWMGHPMANMDQVLDQILANKWDVKAEAQRVEDEAKAEKAREALLKPYNDALQAKDYTKAVTEADKLIAKDASIERDIFYGKYNALLRCNEPEAYAYARKLCNGLCKEDAGAQYSMARAIIDGSDLKTPSYDLALDMTTRAVELTNRENPILLFYQSKAQFKTGDKQKAIETGNKALEIAQKPGSDYPESTIKLIKDTVEGYGQ